MPALQTTHPAIYCPEELRLLTRVCSKVRRERGIRGNEAAAKDIADLAFILYSSGLQEEKALFRKLRQQA